MRLFLDTEFTGLTQAGQLISLALVSEDDRWFYAEFTDYDAARLSDWHRTHVVAHLNLTGSNIGRPDRLRQWEAKGNTASITADLREWLSQFGGTAGEPVEIWGDCLAYDWVLFCQLFGGALHLPKQLFYIPFDLATLLKIKGIHPDIPREQFAFEENLPDGFAKHNALWDGRAIKKCYQRLMEH